MRILPLWYLKMIFVIILASQECNTIHSSIIIIVY